MFLEAAASGKPAVGGRSGGVPEAVADGVTGLLVGGTDVEELATTIARLMDSEALRRSLGEAGRARAVREFGWECAAERVSTIHTATGETGTRRPRRHRAATDCTMSASSEPRQRTRGRLHDFRHRRHSGCIPGRRRRAPLR